MNPMPEITPMLKELRLSGVMDSLEIRNRQAIEEKLAYTDFLALILQDEVARRAQKKLALA
ncbi:MAG: ATP-binding protein, partial [bacterium]|nr:ATP-binding protein [bacterium]